MIDKKYLKYLIGDRFYLKMNVVVECAEITSTISHIHEKVQFYANDTIIIEDIKDYEFIFSIGDRIYIYWCDVYTFVTMNCLSIKEVRENKINTILK